MRIVPKKSVLCSIFFYFGFIVFFGVTAWLFWIIDCFFIGWIIFLLSSAGLLLLRLKGLWGSWKSIVAWILSLSVAWGGLYITRPDLEVSFSGTLTRELIRELVHLPSLKGDGLISMGRAYGERKSNWKAPDGYVNNRFEFDGYAVEVLSKVGSVSENVIFQIHGGAFAMGFLDVYRQHAVRYSKYADDATVVSIDYGIAPENKHPTALNQCMKAWEWILEQGYSEKNIIIVGDSAGGNLTLALTAKLRDSSKELPKAIICISPWCDMTASGESYTYNKFNDPIFGVTNDNEVIESKLIYSYADNADKTDKYLSPVFGYYNGFPPTLIQVGSYEVIESESIAVYNKLNQNNVDVTLSDYKGMFHTFQILADFIPESKAAWSEIESFIQKHI